MNESAYHEGEAKLHVIFKNDGVYNEGDNSMNMDDVHVENTFEQRLIIDDESILAIDKLEVN